MFSAEQISFLILVGIVIVFLGLAFAPVEIVVEEEAMPTKHDGTKSFDEGFL